MIAFEGSRMTTSPAQILPTTVVGSYPQPDWLVDRELLSKSVARAKLSALWRIPEPHLEAAQDDATIVAIRDMERAGIDIVTDGEIRRESYSNRFATALEGIDSDTPGLVTSSTGRTTPVPRIVGPIRRTAPVEVRDMEFLRRNTDRLAKITMPGPFTMSQQAKDEYYKDPEAVAMAFAAAVNEEVLALEAAGADVIQLDEPWVPHRIRRLAVADGRPGPPARRRPLRPAPRRERRDTGRKRGLRRQTSDGSSASSTASSTDAGAADPTVVIASGAGVCRYDATTATPTNAASATTYQVVTTPSPSESAERPATTTGMLMAQ